MKTEIRFVLGFVLLALSPSAFAAGTCNGGFSVGQSVTVSCAGGGTRTCTCINNVAGGNSMNCSPCAITIQGVRSVLPSSPVLDSVRIVK